MAGGDVVERPELMGRGSRIHLKSSLHVHGSIVEEDQKQVEVFCLKAVGLFFTGVPKRFIL